MALPAVSRLTVYLPRPASRLPSVVKRTPVYPASRKLSSGLSAGADRSFPAAWVTPAVPSAVT